MHHVVSELELARLRVSAEEDDAAALGELDGVDVDGGEHVLDHDVRQLHVPLVRLHVVEDDEGRGEELGAGGVGAPLRCCNVFA